MRSSSRTLTLSLAFVALAAAPRRARAQEQARGFAVERFYPSAPGGAWFVMDDLTMRGGLGGALSITGGYARKPLVLSDGLQRIDAVAHQAFADIGAAVTYDRHRLYVNLTSPLVIGGEGGTIAGRSFTAPHVDLGKAPDLITDARVGYDVRLLGTATSPFRLGVGAQLIVPNGNRTDYETDDTYRAMLRVLVAGEVGSFTYAAHVGEHVRPLDDTGTPGSPRGSELLFGVAAGPRFPVTGSGSIVAVVGPELYGATAFSSFLGSTSTALEAILSGRVEGTAGDGLQTRAKLGAGAGLNAHFGAPEWRFVVGFEIYDHHTDRDGDGISDSHDACPDTPGVKSADAKTNGCPPS
jgi:hypothetical protein